MMKHPMLYIQDPSTIKKHIIATPSRVRIHRSGILEISRSQAKASLLIC